MNYTLSGKVMIIRLTAEQIKKISLCKMSYCPEPGSHTINKIKIESDLSNYTTKSDLNAATGINTPEFA